MCSHLLIPSLLNCATELIIRPVVCVFGVNWQQSCSLGAGSLCALLSDPLVINASGARADHWRWLCSPSSSNQTAVGCNFNCEHSLQQWPLRKKMMFMIMMIMMMVLVELLLLVITTECANSICRIFIELTATAAAETAVVAAFI